MLNKANVITVLQTKLNLKLAYQKDTLRVAIISRNLDTKSSAGDKFETSREMAQIEITKIEAEILKTQQFIADLISKASQFIITDKGAFLISIPFSKLTVKNTEIFCISNTAPITKHLANTKASVNFNYRGVEYNVSGVT